MTDHGSVTPGARTGTQAYMVGAVVVAVLLIVGGALFLFTGSNARDGDARDATPASDPLAGATTSVLDTVPSDTAAVVAPRPTEVPVTTVPTPSSTAAPVPSSTAAPVPSSTVPPAPPTTAPPTTAPPTTASPATTAAPVATAAPTPPVTSAPLLTAAEAETFFRAYVAAADAGDYVVAWNQLSANDQADYADGGFDQFVRFWQSVSFAEVQRIESVGGSAGFQSFMVDMAYGQADGGRTSLEVIEVDVNVRPDGTVQIFDYRYLGQQ